MNPVRIYGYTEAEKHANLAQHFAYERRMLAETIQKHKDKIIAANTPYWWASDEAKAQAKVKIQEKIERLAPEIAGLEAEIDLEEAQDHARISQQFADELNWLTHEARVADAQWEEVNLDATNFYNVENACTMCAENVISGASLNKLIVALKNCEDVDFTRKEMTDMTAMLNTLHYKVEERHEKVKACQKCNELISNGCNEGVELTSFNVIRSILVKLQFKDETELVIHK